MSTRHTESLLVKLMSEIERSNARKSLSRSRHMVNIREKDLAEAYKDAYNRVRAKDSSLPDPTGWKIFNSAAKAAIKELRLFLAKGHTRAYESAGSVRRNSASYITYVSPRGYGPTRLLKAVGVQYINRKLSEVGQELSSSRGSNREMSQAALFKTAIEFHHKGTTVGAAQLSQALAFLDRTDYWSDFTRSAEITSLRDIFGDFDLKFKTNPSDLSVKIKEDAIIVGEVGSHRKNFAGSELNDWQMIKPQLEVAMRAWAEKQDWWNRPGSNTLAEDANRSTEHVVMAALTQSKHAKAGKKTKRVNRKSKTAGKTFKGSEPKFTGATKTASTSVVKKGVSSAPFELLGVINSQLPETVQANMGAPRLENRTGRFASSVRVTDIMMTGQGYPSIGYTYQRAPYEVFEKGNAQGSIARDPRRLIDYSIREIAAKHAIGRFYTRRV